MFGKLREKISGWFRGKKEEKDSGKVEEESGSKKVPSAGSKRKESKVGREEKAIKAKKEKKVVKKSVEEKLKEKADKIKEEVSVKFEVAKQKFEPDLEEIEGLVEDSEEKIGSETVMKAKEEEEPLSEEKVEEEVKETLREDRPGVAGLKEKRGFFGMLADKLTKSVLKQEDFTSLFDDFELTLLENNVALGVVDAIRENLAKELVGKQFKKFEVEGKILEALKISIEVLLIEPPDFIDLIRKKKDGRDPYVILFFGINGAGKTTSIAKVAHMLNKKNISCVLAAGDTFRAASIEQLETHAKKLKVDIVKGEYGKDPSSVAYDAISYAKKHKKKVVLIDTAGRMYTKSNLMKEMEKIVRVSKPDLKIFVGESITGNDATEQARMFAETAGIDGIILSKADVDEKAGTILSVSYVTGKPIFFLGIGQGYDDLEVFSKKNVLKHLGLD